jgi:endo-1,4-beta-xylanase
VLAAQALSFDPAALAQGTNTARGNSCHIDYTIDAQFFRGFLVMLDINNTGKTPISAWTLTWSFADGQTITSLFNGSLTQTGANVSVHNAVYDGNIPAGGSLSLVGFEGTWNGITNSIPTSFTLNGTACN